MTDYSFQTKIWNKRKDPALLYDSDGRVIKQLGPGEIVVIESSNDKTLIAPFQEVIFEKDGSISLTKRSGWVDPYETAPWRVEFINLEGKDVEERLAGGKVISLPRNFPVIVFVESLDPWADAERVEIKKVKERRKVPQWAGYLCWVPVLKDVRTFRPDKGQRKILEDRKGPDTTQVPSDTK